MSQQASVGGPREPEARASGHLSMEHAPLRRKGKGGEAPQLHRPLSSLDRAKAGLTGQSKLLIFQALRLRDVDHHSSVMDLLEGSNI